MIRGPSFPLTTLLAAAISLAMQGLPAIAQGQPPAPSMANAPSDAFSAYLRAQLFELETRFRSSASVSSFGPEIDRLFDVAIAYFDPARDMDVLHDIDLLRRQIRALGHFKPEQVAPFKALFAANPYLSATVFDAIGPDDNTAGALRVLKLLADKFPDRVKDPPATDPRAKQSGKKPQRLDDLVAAFCIVFDGELRSAAPLDEERVVQLFEYFSTNFDRMTGSLGHAPELLAFVVSTPVSIEELNWAQKGYSGNRQVGRLYGSIVYDSGAFEFGRPKKILSQAGGYTLMNIKKVGGVCVEQAYFAANVGCAIGIPTVIVGARGSDVAHAWVGYLKQIGSKFEWDFDEGRYEEYQSLRGDVLDPQSGKTVPDGYIALTAGYLNNSRNQNRAKAVACFDAAERLAAIQLANTHYPPELASDVPKPPTVPRPLGVATQLQLIESGLRFSTASRRGWEMVARLATARKLSGEQLDLWSKRVIELCGDDYPDFAFAMLSPMIQVITPIEQQEKMWEWLHGKFNQRKDLAAAVRFAQGQMWEDAKKPTRAWDLYTECIERYANDGTIILDALRNAERLLERQGKPEQALALYQNGFSRITKPDRMSNEFAAGSMYVAVGRKYADLLERAGKVIDARKVRDAVDVVIGKEKKAPKK